ncbi:MAG: hypothetical protein HWD59_06585 [Coxiellaceae bacterium]|nr:MAG: hypothetical protein HWD59_06585 [Coxiellaceae bacterium]
MPDKVFFYQNGQFHFRDYFNPLEKVITYVNQSLVLEAMQTGADDGSNQKIQQILNTAYKAGLLTNDDIELADEYYQLNLTPTQQL